MHPSSRKTLLVAAASVLLYTGSTTAQDPLSQTTLRVHVNDATLNETETGATVCGPYGCSPASQVCGPWGCVPAGQICPPQGCIPPLLANIVEDVASTGGEPATCPPQGCIPPRRVAVQPQLDDNNPWQVCSPFGCAAAKEICGPWGCIPTPHICPPQGCIPPRLASANEADAPIQAQAADSPNAAKTAQQPLQKQTKATQGSTSDTPWQICGPIGCFPVNPLDSGNASQIPDQGLSICGPQGCMQLGDLLAKAGSQKMAAKSEL